MEASRFGFGDASSGYKFDPTDADIVASYLLPRALGLRHPYEHAIIDDDPTSLPPWELLRKHGHADSRHAFFFGPAADRTKNAGRKNRAVAGGGTWRGQKGVDESLTLLSPDGREQDIKYKRYNLTYYRDGERGTTGWVMHEYEITSPPLPGIVLSRIRVTDKGKKDKQRQQAQGEVPAGGADQQVFPDPEQPGPSHQYHAGHVAGNATVMGDGQGYGGAQTDVAHGDNGGGMGETGGYYTSLHYAGEGGGDCGNYYNADGGDFRNNYFNAGGDDNMYFDAGGDDTMYHGDVKYEPYDDQENGH